MRKRWLMMLLLLTLLPGWALGDSLTVWVPYWDAESALEDLTLLEGKTDGVILFAALFDEEDHLLLLPEVDALWNELLLREVHPLYLSVVNDQRRPDGTFDNKSAPLMGRVLRDDAAIDCHVADLIALTQDMGADGLEIDYEALEDGQWPGFADFVGKLWTAAEGAGLGLRIVLECGTAGRAAFPKGPTYSIMAYNLFGSHSGEGPKADEDFLRRVCRDNLVLGAGTHMALADGGFLWREDGVITQLTQAEAWALLRDNDVSPDSLTRDKASGVLTGTIPLPGHVGRLWVADRETLDFWRAICREEGYADVDLFRLGSHDMEDFARFAGAYGGR